MNARLRHPLRPVVVLLAVAAAVAPAASGAAKRAFVTSVSGNGDLSSWPDSHGLTGLAAADEICRTRAQAAALPEPGQFVAWLSDTDDDAYCRLHGLAGQMVANCGQSSLPADAGPWARTDGRRFAPAIAQLTAGVVYNAVTHDEFGLPVGFAAYFTATGPEGAHFPSPSGACSDWTAAPVLSVLVGVSTRTSEGWSTAGTGSCVQAQRLVCLQGGGAGPVLPTPLGGGQLVFLSSQGGNGELGTWPSAGGETGTAAGNEVCRTLAADAGLDHPETFIAWLSDDLGGQSPVAQFDFLGPFVRPDGTRVADDLHGLIDGTLDSSIHQLENGTYLGTYGVWTGTDPDGNSSGADCAGWTSGSAAASGDFGLANSIDGFWSSSLAPITCDVASRRLYCFGNYPDPTIFVDGFESGDLSAWSSAVP